MENEFRRHYKEHVMPALQKQHGYKNVHQIPKVEKVVINTSVGSQSDVKQALEKAKAELALITGQRPMETLAKKSISNFKLRKDQAIGAKVTLRGEQMYEFLGALHQGCVAAHSRFPRRISDVASTSTATTPSAFPTSQFFPKSNSTKSSATLDLMLQLSLRRERTRKLNRF